MTDHIADISISCVYNLFASFIRFGIYIFIDIGNDKKNSDGKFRDKAHIADLALPLTSTSVNLVDFR